MTPRPARQLPLLEPSVPSPLPEDVEAKARALLVELLTAMIPILEQEVRDEQDHR
jgi:hypothetical protein